METPINWESAFPKRCGAALGRGRDSGPTARFPVLPPVPLTRPVCTCSAASGSRCGSSSGTVNWIFRGLLSGSMAPGPAAGDLGLGRARSLSAALRPRPQPGARLAAPGSARPAPLGDCVAADWLVTVPPGPLLPQSGALTPSWLRWRLRGSPPLQLRSQTRVGLCPNPPAVRLPGILEFWVRGRCGKMLLRTSSSEGRFQGIDFGHINVIEFLHSLFDLVLVRLDIHDEHERVVVLYFLHG